MAEINLQFYHGSDLYSDGDVEDEMLEIAKTNPNIEDFEGESFPVIYHFSKIRHNILSWYPFKEGCTILEIGAGCGALTGLLCQKASRVVSMELSHKRSKINYERHKKYNNLEIIVGNLQDIRIDKKFDYIIVNGVLEYAMGFFDSRTPYDDFLLSLKKYMQDDGKVLIAIENRLGLKYFAGAPEDHTDNFFLGLREYDSNKTVRTFSRSELIELLNRVGMEKFNFYYPFPDYKFPREIFTEEFLTEERVGSDYYNLNSERFVLYDEGKVAKSLAKEGIAGHFANSFLVEASTKQIEHKNIPVYVKFSDDRFEQYRITTKIEMVNGKKQVVKSPIEMGAMEHIYSLFARSEQGINSEKMKLLPCTWDGKNIVYEYIESPSLSAEICKKMESQDADGILSLIDEFSECLTQMGQMGRYNTNDFKAVFGNNVAEEEEVCLCPANVDLIFDNVYKRNDMYMVIDYEWLFDFNVPISFLIWRGINELYEKQRKIRELISLEQILDRYNISMEKASQYAEWNKFFCEKYVGTLRYEKIATKKTWLSLNDVMAKMKQDNYVCSSLYIDTGAGYSESEKKYVDTVLDYGEIEVEFDISDIENCVALRWDPIENKACICEILDCTEGIDFMPRNAVSVSNNKALFITNDPIYDILNKLNITHIYIKYRLTILNQSQICDIVQEQIVKDLKDTKRTLHSIYSSRSWRFLERMRRLVGKENRRN